MSPPPAPETSASARGTLHYATADGDYYTFGFVGTGVDLVGDVDTNRGPSDVYVDGAFVERIDASGAGVATQQRLFSARNLTQGPHQVAVYKRGGAYMDVDRADVFGSSLINDDSAAISYVGSAWVYSANRPWGDYQNDVHYTTQDGDSVVVSFVGSGIDFVTETNRDRGAIDVSIDGMPDGRVFTNRASLSTQQTVYELHGLAMGAHSLRLTKRGGVFFAVDAFRILQ